MSVVSELSILKEKIDGLATAVKQAEEAKQKAESLTSSKVKEIEIMEQSE